MVSDLKMSHGKMSDFVSFSLFGFFLVIKLKKFDFKGIKIPQILCPVKQCLIWFKLCCLSQILATSLEIRILHFIKIV